MQDKNTKNRWGDSRPGSTKKFIRFPDDMIQQIESDIERTKGEKKTSFSEWVKDACLIKLSKK
ncbi:MAG: DUF3950 domain-containing protein [Aestuariibacter sp.]|nr:DUF3950 domain-containing protein [Aestuariibacter sp.]MAP21752.1 DUF3950 domain-containing protein [Alteromonadaceae bacterium]MAX41530.1 DUF3950 domain-containing protein [Alteromonadaceae bacterium]|tara:strand:+ start:1671 stop:1859 length:189 start_codon:yes stop_codon:yes gene_type:complete